jgi:hypothetical protein
MSVFCELQTHYCTHVTNIAPATMTGNAVGLVPLILMIPTRGQYLQLDYKIMETVSKPVCLET